MNEAPEADSHVKGSSKSIVFSAGIEAYWCLKKKKKKDVSPEPKPMMRGSGSASCRAPRRMDV